MTRTFLNPVDVYPECHSSGLVLLRPVLATHTNLFRGQSITANLEHPARLFTGSLDRFACLPVLWRLRFVPPGEVLSGRRVLEVAMGLARGRMGIEY